MCERVNMLAEATTFHLEALLVSPQNPRVRFALAEFYERTGRPHLAARQRTLAQR